MHLVNYLNCVSSHEFFFLSSSIGLASCQLQDYRLVSVFKCGGVWEYFDILHTECHFASDKFEIRLIFKRPQRASIIRRLEFLKVIIVRCNAISERCCVSMCRSSFILYHITIFTNLLGLQITLPCHTSTWSSL